MRPKDTIIPINEELELPVSELQFRYATGGGPGGQHANRSATRVTLLFDVANSPSLSDEQRSRLVDQLSGRLTREAVLHVDVQDSRSQWRNRQIAISRLQALLADALDEEPPRLATEPPAAAKEVRLDEKRQRGARKRDRQRRWDEY